MELYHNNMSVCAQKVRLVIAEKQLAPIEHHMMLRNGDTHTPEYLRLNPNGVVPTLIDGGQVIVESTIICEYLEDRYPAVRMMPESALGRARVRQWTQLPDASLHQACGYVSVGIAWRHQIIAAGGAQLKGRSSKSGNNKGYIDVIEHGVGSSYFFDALVAYDSVLDTMRSALESNTWLAGDSYSLADVALIPYVLRLKHLALDWMLDGDRKVIARWFENCRERPNYCGIADYLEPSYIELATTQGELMTSRLREILG